MFRGTYPADDCPASALAGAGTAAEQQTRQVGHRRANKGLHQIRHSLAQNSKIDFGSALVVAIGRAFHGQNSDCTGEVFTALNDRRA